MRQEGWLCPRKSSRGLVGVLLLELQKGMRGPGSRSVPGESMCGSRGREWLVGKGSRRALEECLVISGELPEGLEKRSTGRSLWKGKT